MVDKDKAPKLATEVSKLMSTKYGWNKELIVELVYH
jgi:hypothetical protein